MKSKLTHTHQVVLTKNSILDFSTTAGVPGGAIGGALGGIVRQNWTFHFSCVAWSGNCFGKKKIMINEFYTHLPTDREVDNLHFFKGNTHVKLLTEESSSRFMRHVPFPFLPFIKVCGFCFLVASLLSLTSVPASLFSLTPRSWWIPNFSHGPCNGPFWWLPLPIYPYNTARQTS